MGDLDQLTSLKKMQMCGHFLGVDEMGELPYFAKIYVSRHYSPNHLMYFGDVMICFKYSLIKVFAISRYRHSVCCPEDQAKIGLLLSLVQYVFRTGPVS